MTTKKTTTKSDSVKQEPKKFKKFVTAGKRVCRCIKQFGNCKHK